MGKFVYRCDICKKDQSFPIQPLQTPECRGPDRTHRKDMKFILEKSTGSPDYLTKPSKKKKINTPTTGEQE